MRKRVVGRTFGRKRGQRKALLVAVAKALVEQERVQTTEARAKEVSRFVEPLITKAKQGNLAARRHLLRYFSEKTARRVIEDIAPRYAERPGGYTRVVRLGPRQSDGANMAIVELV